VFSFVAGAFELPFVAAASFRALMSKNPAMILWSRNGFSKNWVDIGPEIVIDLAENA
jgi:hypothetical protein